MLYTKILNENKDFLNLYRKGRYIVSKYIVVYFKKNNQPYNRLGITAGKKVGNAVHRNRAKRIIRQAYRENEIYMPIGYDFVVVARSSIGDGTIKSTQISEYMHKILIKEIEKCS